MERIDFHAHCVPPAYREYCLQNDFAGRGHPDGMPAIPVRDQPNSSKVIMDNSTNISGMGRAHTHPNDEKSQHKNIHLEYVISGNSLDTWK